MSRWILRYSGRTTYFRTPTRIKVSSGSASRPGEPAAAAWLLVVVGFIVQAPVGRAGSGEVTLSGYHSPAACMDSFNGTIPCSKRQEKTRALSEIGRRRSSALARFGRIDLCSHAYVPSARRPDTLHAPGPPASMSVPAPRKKLRTSTRKRRILRALAQTIPTHPPTGYE